MFKKFKDNEIAKYLNENSLNQAGYEVEIENYSEMDYLDVDDYFYAFDKEDWTKKELFKQNQVKTKKHILISYTPDGKEIRTESEKNEVKEVVSEGTIDYKTVDFYKEKLKLKTKSYNGGIIILSEFESPSQTSAFSRTSPLNHSFLFVYSDSVEKKEDYAHEIGHMLGLPHLFYNQKEKNAFKNARESILGNGLPLTDIKRTEGIQQHILNVTESNIIYWSWINLTAIKNNMIDKMKIHDIQRQAKITELEIAKNPFKKYGDSHLITFSDKAKTKLTKKEYFKLLDKGIEEGNIALNENKIAISELESRTGNKYESLTIYSNYTKTDMLEILEQNKVYNYRIIDQIRSNFITFNKVSTKNIMDYDNTKVFFLNHQIKIMREDIQNYIDILSVSKSKIK